MWLAVSTSVSTRWSSLQTGLQEPTPSPALDGQYRPSRGVGGCEQLGPEGRLVVMWQSVRPVLVSVMAKPVSSGVLARKALAPARSP